MKSSRLKSAIGAALLITAFVVSGCGSDKKSEGAGSTSTTAQTGSSAVTGGGSLPSGQTGPVQGGPTGETLDQVKGASGKKVKAVATKAAGGGKIIAVVKDQRGKGGYVVMIQKKDGSRVVVLVDKHFKVTGTQEVPGTPDAKPGYYAGATN